jgi:MFS-type transporter involved in bile tolerance (Atg22 family)
MTAVAAAADNDGDTLDKIAPKDFDLSTNDNDENDDDDHAHDAAESPNERWTRRRWLSVLAWIFYDCGNSTYPTTVASVFLPLYYKNTLAATLDSNTASVSFSLTVTLVLIIQALVAPIMGAFADSRYARKPILAAAAALGIFATLLFFFMQGNMWIPTLVLYVCN